jgi:demethoxyubiquinone hydroxylase (CLK1/Coq7/Cat5 family)
METSQHRKLLVHVLHMAYSGEKAAGCAYNGHWRSLKNPDERAAIKRIEQEEWDHRAIVSAMLKELGAQPDPLRDWWMDWLVK